MEGSIQIGQPATATWWAAAVWRVRVVHPGVPLPVAALTLEAAALLTITIALAAAGSRLAPERRGGVMAAPALLAVTGAAILLPARVALYAQPGGPGWAGAHQRWAMLLGVALAAFAVASRDPAHGHVRRRVRSRVRNRFHRLARGRLTKHADPGPARGAEEDQAGLTQARTPGDPAAGSEVAVDPWVGEEPWVA